MYHNFQIGKLIFYFMSNFVSKEIEECRVLSGYISRANVETKIIKKPDRASC